MVSHGNYKFCSCRTGFPELTPKRDPFERFHIPFAAIGEVMQQESYHFPWESFAIVFGVWENYSKCCKMRFNSVTKRLVLATNGGLSERGGGYPWLSPG